jgi:glycosyltransferase involved in cell wall biosynthesis
LVKEANALHAAGYEVHVVAGWYYPPLDPFDREIYAAAPWPRTMVYYLTGPRVILRKLWRRWALRRLPATHRPRLGLATRAIHAATHLIAKAASKVEADLYLAHNLPGLAAAGIAAKKNRKLLGFDAEDFHRAETEDVAAGGPIANAIAAIESAWLPRCAHFTAASPLISRAYAETYSVDAPISVLNVFPLSEAPSVPVLANDPAKPPSLYWFSQTIGPARGLERLVAALGKMQVRCDLHLRGTPAADFMPRIRALASASGFEGKLEIHPIASASEMARLASHYDLGLALEQSWPPNRDYCLTNKIFTYLLAGLPVAMTPTSAQRALAEQLGDAALLLDFDDVSQVAAQLDGFFSQPERMRRARAAAWQAAQTRFNWDQEKKRFLGSIEQALERSSAS